MITDERREDAKGLVLLIACHMGVAYDDVMKQGEVPAVVRARDISALLVRRKYGLTYFQLGDFFGQHPVTIKLATYRAARCKWSRRMVDELREKM